MFNLANELADQGVRVTIGLKKVKGQFRPNGTLDPYIARSKAPVVFVERASKELFQLIKAADLVHAQNTSIDIALMTVLLRTPLVLTIHGWLRKRWTPRAMLARITNRLADRRWYNSDFVWSKWEPGEKQADSGKLPIVSNLPVGIVDAADRRGFLFASRWIENKGLEVLLEAYAQADLDREAWPLVLLGDGPLRERIFAIIHDRGIDGVEVKGFVDDETRNYYMRHARWMVTPPHTNEDLGLTPIEARHVGVPCIITRDGGLPEAGGKHALICAPGNVEQLRDRLEQAAHLEEDAYRRLSRATHEELLDYLQPLSLYLLHYRAVLREHEGGKERRRSKSGRRGTRTDGHSITERNVLREPEAHRAEVIGPPASGAA
jgi:glycosyltransferase involved in cell wall biosynthesis